MERFNSIVDIIWAIIFLCIMVSLSYFLWTIDFWWGAASTAVSLAIICWWWVNGTPHMTDDLALPHGEKEKFKFWENILYILSLPFRFLFSLFY